MVATPLTRPLHDPILIVVGDLHAPDGLEVGFELWRVPFVGWGIPHELRALRFTRWPLRAYRLPEFPPLDGMSAG